MFKFIKQVFIALVLRFANSLATTCVTLNNERDSRRNAHRFESCIDLHLISFITVHS